MLFTYIVAPYIYDARYHANPYILSTTVLDLHPESPWFHLYLIPSSAVDEAKEKSEPPSQTSRQTSQTSQTTSQTSRQTSQTTSQTSQADQEEDIFKQRCVCSIILK